MNIAHDISRLGMALIAALPCPAAETMPTMTANPGFEAGTNGWQIPNAF